MNRLVKKHITKQSNAVFQRAEKYLIAPVVDFQNILTVVYTWPNSWATEDLGLIF